MISREINRIIIHCSATDWKQDVTAKDIDGWHRARGWDCIGYHGVIRMSGTWEWGRDLGRPGAHTRGHNLNSIGICLIGGMMEGNPAPTYTLAQLSTLKQSIDFFLKAWPDAEVLGHRDLSPDVNHDGIIDRTDWLKECPCFDVRHWLETGIVEAEVKR